MSEPPTNSATSKRPTIKIRVAAWCGSEQLAQAIRTAAMSIADFSFAIEMREHGHTPSANLLETDVLIVDLDLEDEREHELLTQIIERRGARRPVIATAASAAMNEVRLLMRFGVADFLPQPVTGAELGHSLRGLTQRLTVDAPVNKTGAVAVFMRPVGGAGATTLATHAALALASKDPKRQIAVLDLDLQSGAVGLHLDLKSDVGVIDCLDRFTDIEPGLIKSVAARHSTGLDVLVATANRRPLDEYPPQAIEQLIETMRRIYDVVVVDTPPVWTHWHSALLAHADVAVLVLQKSVANLRFGRNMMTALHDSRLGADQIITVCNRVQQKWFGGDISNAEAERALGTKIDVSIPSDYALVSEAVNLGVSVSRVKPGSKFEKAVETLAGEIERRLARRHDKAAPSDTSAPATIIQHTRSSGGRSNEARHAFAARRD